MVQNTGVFQIEEKKASSSMKILQLCLKPPLPAKDGGCIAMHNITRGLQSEGHKVKILTIFTLKHDFIPEELDQEYLDSTEIEGVYIDTRVNAVDAFSSFLTSDSYNINRFFSTDFDIKLTKILKKENYDIIHLESLFMTPYLATIRRWSKSPVVLRSHNLEFVIWEKIASGTSSFFKKIYMKYLATKLRKYELGMLDQVSGIASISEDDKTTFRELGVKKPISNIPVGLDFSNYEINVNQKVEFCLFHLGAMDWGPNLEGVLWFLDKIWPSIHQKFPDLKLYLAGRSIPEALATRGYPNVIISGEIDNAIEYIKSKAVMIVPLLSAGGVRVKIVEGLALEKAIISTRIGAQGLNCRDGKDILLADSKEEWLLAVQKIVDNAALVRSLGKEGRKHSESEFNITAVTAKLIDFYKELIQA
jgi:polysaccharide biosynthesis protein PslH